MKVVLGLIQSDHRPTDLSPMRGDSESPRKDLSFAMRVGYMNVR